MTERKITMKEVCVLYIDGCLLKDVVQILTKLLDQYGDTAMVSKEQDRYSENQYMVLLNPTPETDAEMEHRCNLKQKWQQARDIRDRAEFDRLQAKFGAIQPNTHTKPAL